MILPGWLGHCLKIVLPSGGLSPPIFSRKQDLIGNWWHAVSGFSTQSYSGGNRPISIGVVGATMLLGDNVLDVKRKKRKVAFMKLTELAALPST
jgi:hypothetical protein